MQPAPHRTQFDAQERMVYAVHIAETFLGLRARNREIKRDKLRTKAQKIHNAKNFPKLSHARISCRVRVAELA